MTKSDIVMAHVQWLQPSAWVAADDEDVLWPKSVADHVCIVDGLKGLKTREARDKLSTYLRVNFGPAR